MAHSRHALDGAPSSVCASSPGVGLLSASAAVVSPHRASDRLAELGHMALGCRMAKTRKWPAGWRRGQLSGLTPGLAACGIPPYAGRPVHLPASRGGRMSDIFDLLPDHQTKMFDEESEQGLRRTPKGMAHWSGGGPRGKTCRECQHYTNEGRYSSGSKRHAASQLKPGRCRKTAEIQKAQELTKKSTKPPVFPWYVAACKHFEQHPNPPVAVEQKYGTSRHR